MQIGIDTVSLEFRNQNVASHSEVRRGLRGVHGREASGAGSAERAMHRFVHGEERAGKLAPDWGWRRRRGGEYFLRLSLAATPCSFRYLCFFFSFFVGLMFR